MPTPGRGNPGHRRSGPSLPRATAAALLWLLAWTALGLAAGPSVTVSAPSPALAERVREVIATTAPRLARLTGAAPPAIQVQVAASEEEFQRLAAAVGGPAWAAGLALPRQGRILMRSPRQLTDPDNFPFLVAHELTHLYLGTALRGRPAPLWLEEGLAMYVAQEGGWGLALEMTRAVLGGRLLPLARLERRFPPGAEQARLAYAQSFYLISYLIEAHGPGVLPRLLRELAAGRDLTTALWRATGRGPARLEQDFRRAMEERFHWLGLLAAGGFLWGLVGLLAAVGLVWRWRRQRPSRQPEEAAEERPAPPVRGNWRRWPPPPRRRGVLTAVGLGPRGGEPSPPPKTR